MRSTELASTHPLCATPARCLVCTGNLGVREVPYYSLTTFLSPGDLCAWFGWIRSPSPVYLFILWGRLTSALRYLVSGVADGNLPTNIFTLGSYAVSVEIRSFTFLCHLSFLSVLDSVVLLWGLRGSSQSGTVQGLLTRLAFFQGI